METSHRHRLITDHRACFDDCASLVDVFVQQRVEVQGVEDVPTHQEMAWEHRL